MGGDKASTEQRLIQEYPIRGGTHRLLALTPRVVMAREVSEPLMNSCSLESMAYLTTLWPAGYTITFSST